MRYLFLAACLALQTSVVPAQNPLPDAPPAKPMVYKPGGDVISPKVIYAVDPEYTEEARKDRLQGATTLSLVVDAEGNPHEIKVTRSAAEDAKPEYRHAAHSLDDKALEAARQYRFKPGTLKGKPVAVAVSITIAFQLF